MSSKAHVLDRGAGARTRAEDRAEIAATRLPTILAVYAAIEFLTAGIFAFVASVLYHQLVFHSPPPTTRYILAAALLATLIVLISVQLKQFAGLRRRPLHMFLWNGVGSTGLAFSIFLTILFVTKIADDYSRGTFIFQIVTVTLAVAIVRALFYRWLQSAIAGSLVKARRVVLIGDAAHCLRFANRLAANGIQTAGSFRFPKYRAGGSGPSSRLRDIIDGCRQYCADDIIILSGNDDLSRALEVASCLSELPSGIHFIPVDALDVLASARVTIFGDFLTIQLRQPPLSVVDRAVKRAFDIVASTLGLIALSPLFVFVSLALKLDSSGPVFFRQARHGFNNDEIYVYKFRSMTWDDSNKAFTQTAKNDPRITRVGRILRSTNIDELPQLINVLRGEMSIVGPRPHAVAHNELFSKAIGLLSRRHIVKPGITGWAQVNGHRGATDTVEKMMRRIEFDLYYIDNWSFLLDLKIILMTLFSKRAYTNAY